MQYNQFSANIDVRYQTIVIEDQAPSSVGPDLDPYCLQKSFKINYTYFCYCEKMFHFVQELFEGTVYGVCTEAKNYLVIELI